MSYCLRFFFLFILLVPNHRNFNLTWTKIWYILIEITESDQRVQLPFCLVPEHILVCISVTTEGKMAHSIPQGSCTADKIVVLLFCDGDIFTILPLSGVGYQGIHSGVFPDIPLLIPISQYCFSSHYVPIPNYVRALLPYKWMYASIALYVTINRKSREKVRVWAVQMGL